MSIQEDLIDKWQQCRERRYPVLIIITAPRDRLLSSVVVDEFAEIIKAEKLDFQKIYQDRLDHFFTWQTIREKICRPANNRPVIVTELEPFYAKWPVDERQAFLKNLLRSEPVHPVILIINCREDLSELQAIEENSRGIIWAPT